MSKVLHISCSNCPSKGCIFCSSLSADGLQKLEKEKVTVKYSKGQFIFFEGGTSTNVYCIYQGKVKIIKQSPDGKEQIVYIAKSGDLMGTKDVLSGKGYTTSACTMEDSVVCTIPKEIFFSLLESNIQLYSSVNAHLCRVLGLIEDKVLNFSQRSVRERIAINILTLNDNFGVRNNDQILIDLPLSREDMANMVGTATETVIRILSDFRKEGLVEFNGKRMTITNLNNLRKVAST